MAGTSSTTAWTVACPAFFKVYFPHTSSHQLLIPYAFVEEHERILTQKLVLTDSSGKKWPVNLDKRSKNHFFKEGWEDFVKDNDLELGEFIVFSYLGNSTFRAKVYGIDACEKKIKTTTSGLEQPSLRQEEVRGQEEEKEADEEEGKSRTIPLHSDKRNNKRPFVDHLSAKFERMLRRAQDSESDLWDVKIVSRFEDDIVAAGQSYIHMPRAASGRHSDPVIDKIDSNLAFEAAMRYVSTFPCFIITIGSAYVSSNSLNIPKSFAIENMELADQDVKLQRTGKSWSASIHCYNSALKMINGWSAFVKDNGLQVGDVCVFELIEDIDNAVFEVSIFRSRGQAEQSSRSAYGLPTSPTSKLS